MRLIAILSCALLAAPLAAAQTPPTPPVAPAAPTFVLTAPSYARYARASEVQLRDVVAYVRVRPENRSDVSVAIINNGPLPAPRLRLSGRRLIVDGGMRRQIRNCEVEGGAGFEVRTGRFGTVEGSQIPTIELRVPQAAVVAVNGAVRLRMAPAQSAVLRLDGCGDGDVERVAEGAEISVSGSSELRVFDVGALEAAVAGSSNLRIGVVRDGLTVSLAGSGGVAAARADGETSIALQGSGDVLVRDGRATTLSVAIAGSGNVIHNGTAQSLDAAIFGSGDVHVRQVSGEISRSTIGSGDVIIGR
ncbi:GIN domain-containing protein [Terricaulis silvestris]|uniref:Putative auto-transporter adhesin head GIN domain-containing protein n=1 Tax=Terricaulis silvestris TaxID=2686094 RepID=A0A6I6MYX2_9CAUL|nr:DUF2807 domain-containing protein [Terricaulis silvestris]QGZ96333.1 hypothetical protein DSM104635_03192 [Terricaulis silvestris]